MSLEKGRELALDYFLRDCLYRSPTNSEVPFKIKTFTCNNVNGFVGSLPKVSSVGSWLSGQIMELMNFQKSCKQFEESGISHQV